MKLALSTGIAYRGAIGSGREMGFTSKSGLMRSQIRLLMAQAWIKKIQASQLAGFERTTVFFVEVDMIIFVVHGGMQ